jgi:uncharacterized protein YndB with AHSA1/START domain
MTIAPIVRSVEIKAAPSRAFELFSRRMGAWWPSGKTVGNPHVDIVIEPHAGGRWIEIDADGTETQWGEVLAWEPPSRLLLAWRLNAQWTYDPSFLTEVELTFAALAGGGTRVTLEHRDLERFGEDAEARRASLDGGWPTRLADFVAFADATG